MTSERTAAHLRNFVTKKTAQSTKAPSILQATVEMPRDSIKLPATRHSATHCPIHLPQGCLPATHPQKMTCKGFKRCKKKLRSGLNSQQAPTKKCQRTQLVLVQCIFQVVEVQGIAPLAGYFLLSALVNQRENTQQIFPNPTPPKTY